MYQIRSGASLIEELAELMRVHKLCSLEVQQGEIAIALRFPPSRKAIAFDVRSPSRGTAMLRHPTQHSDTVKVGDRVKAGQVIALLSHGPLYSLVRSPRAGTIARIYAEHGRVVQPNEPLVQLA